MSPAKARKTKSTRSRKTSARKPASTKQRAGTTKRRASARPPVKRMSQTLARLDAHPESPDLLAQAQADLDQQGLQAFFDATAQTPAGQRAQHMQAKARELALTIEDEQTKSIFGSS